MVAQALGAKVVSLRPSSVAAGAIHGGANVKKAVLRKMRALRVRRGSTKGSGQGEQGGQAGGVGVQVEPVTGADGVGVHVLG